jgi:hypothetical protein
MRGCQEALQKRIMNLSVSEDMHEIHFCAKEQCGMWGYWSVDGLSAFVDTMEFQKDGNGSWKVDDQDLVIVIHS